MQDLYKKDDTNTRQLQSITFRVSPENKAKLSKLAEEHNISLSKYVRRRALMDDSDLQSDQERNELNIRNGEMKNQPHSKTMVEVNPAAIIFQTTPEGKEILKVVFSNFRWNRFSSKNKEIIDDHDLSAAVGFTVLEGIVEQMSDMTGLRKKYNINSVEGFFRSMLVH